MGQRPMLKEKPGDLKHELKTMVDTAETCAQAYDRTCGAPPGSRVTVRPANNDLDALLTIDHEHQHPDAGPATSAKVTSAIPPGTGKSSEVKKIPEESAKNSQEKEPSPAPKSALASKVEQPNPLVQEGVFLDDGFKRCTNIRIAARRHAPDTCNLQREVGNNDSKSRTRLNDEAAKKLEPLGRVNDEGSNKLEPQIRFKDTAEISPLVDAEANDLLVPPPPAPDRREVLI